jgi:DNA repair protein RecO (recombination protein O)
MSLRVQNHPGFVLHARDYSETSLLLEVFTRQYGRLGLLAKGARRPSSKVRGMLKPFQPLMLSWSGRGELPVLTGAEVDGQESLIAGSAIYCGFYLNELLVRLLHRDDPHERLYDAYRDTLTALARTSETEAALRVFEKCLLGDIGYGLVLDRDVGTNALIEPDAWYDYVPERGPVKLANPELGRARGVVIRGACLNALAGDVFTDPVVLRDAKRLMRTVLAHYLGDKPLHSRKLFHGTGARAVSETADVGG